MSEQSPYDSPPQAPNIAIDKSPLVGEPIIHRFEAKPIERLKQAKAQLGDQYWLFLGIALVGLVVGSLAPMALLMGPMMCGMYLCFRERIEGRPTKFELLFKGFDYFVDALIATLIMVGVSLVFILPVYLFMVAMMIGGAAMEEQGLAPVFMVGVFLSYIMIFVVSIFIYVPFVFIFPLIVNRRMKGLDAVKLSWKAAKQNLGAIATIIIVNSILSLLGSCACYVPAILLMPLTLASIFFLYHEAFEFPDEKAKMNPAQGN
jgi:hypothetical protein